MAVSQIFDENYISNSFLNPEMEVSKITFSGTDDQVRLGMTEQVEGSRAVAVGAESSTSADSTIAIGDRSSATGTGGVAVGVETVSDEHGLALGSKAKSTGENSIACGHETEANHSNCIVLSNDGQKTNHANQIILSTSNIFPTNTASGVYITDIRNRQSSAYRNLVYNTMSGELFYESESGGEQFHHDSGIVILKNLPTEDPDNEGQLWQDSANDFVLKVSQGSD